MAFTATIQSINLQNDQFTICVAFNDSATGFNANKTYTVDSITTQAAMVALITADGTSLKANLAKNNILQSKTGTVLII